MRHAATTPPAHRSAVVFVLAVLAAAAACSPSTGAIGTPSTPAPTSNASVAAPTSDATPPPTPAYTGPIGPAPSPLPTLPASASPAPSPAAATIIRAYFLANDATGRGTLVPVLRSVPHTVAVGRAALNALLAGPSAAELAASPALYTAIPVDTRLLDISIAGSIATVDLSSEFASGGGAGLAYGRLAQLVYTLTQFPTVTQVQLELDGAAATLYSGDGVVLNGTAKRTDYGTQLPAIFVDRPAWGGAAGNPATLQGYANVFEAQFIIQIRDGSGAVLSSKTVIATCGTGCWGTFAASLPYAVGSGQWGTLRVYDASAKDGSPENARVYPVWLSPAG